MKNNQKDASTQQENQNIFPVKIEENTAGTGVNTKTGINETLPASQSETPNLSDQKDGTDETIGIP